MNEALVVVVRSIVAFFTLLIFARLLGKRQINQLTFFDYVLGITIGSAASTLTTDLSSRAWPHFVGLFCWTAIVLAIQWITLKSRQASQYIDGEPTLIIMNGKIMEEAMNKLRYRVSDLLEQLRIKGVFDLSQVEFAILERDGQLSILKKSQHLPVTPQDLNISTKYQGLNTEIIYDGVVLEHNLKQVNLDRSWMMTELQKQGIKDPDDVFLATLDSDGKLYVDTYKDKLNKILQVDISKYHGPI